MVIDDIQTLKPGNGLTVSPALSDYDDASEGWTESEHRAEIPGDHVVGFWTGEPGWVRIDDWPYTEVCVILSGSVEIEDHQGQVRPYGQGESFVIPRGFRGIWRTVEPCEKVFVGIS